MQKQFFRALLLASALGFSAPIAHARRAQAQPRTRITWQNLSMNGGCGMGAFLLPVQLATVQDAVASCLQPQTTARVQLVLRGNTPSGLTVTPAAVAPCVTNALRSVQWPAASGSACNVSFVARRNF